MNNPLLTIAVHGTPAGQGAVSFFGRGRAAHSNEKKLKPWRHSIVAAARDAVTLTHPTDAASDEPLMLGPVVAEITITVPKPKSAPKRLTSWPITRYSSDIDHHARAVLDSLTVARVWKDDSQVVELTIRKVYPGEGVDALDQPGAVIRLWQVPAAVAS
ncbi:RusA family crossover junction endodeoxyribonuclease [Nonomuraea angiospora]|uniref:RusA family crossover junction endodeoxyribonuclease n=1 Tax=Nonomuraea angiospora TaxID=46172 RepID=UPI0033C2D7F0